MTDPTEAIREAREQITSALAHLGFSDDSVRAPLHKAARNLKYALDAMVSKPWPAAVPEGEPSEVDGSAWDRLPPAPSAGVAKARAAQAKQVMPIIGPLLDAWDGLSNDTKGVINEESSLGKHLREIDQAMCADISSSPEVKADPLREALMNCLGCVEAAEAEGLHEIVGDLRGRDEQTDRLIDLVERRLMWVRNYADSALAAPQPPAPITTEQIDRETLRQRAREAGDAAYKSWTGKPFSLDGMQIIADAILALSPPVTTEQPDDLADLVSQFSKALLAKLRLSQANGRSGWEKDDWEKECQQGLLRHVEKGDPRDVAAYCAFLWHHGWITAPPVTTDRVAVIEECAKVCDRWIRSKNLHESLAATDIASAIRALVDAKEEKTNSSC